MNKLSKIIYIFLFSILLGLSGCGEPASNTGYDNSCIENSSQPVSDSQADAQPILQPTSQPTVDNTSDSSTNTSEADTAPPSNPTVTISMVGDILLHTPIEKYSKQEDGTYSFHTIFANLKEEIQAADLALVNQEVILGGEELGISGYPAFNAPYAVGDALVSAGFDVICHATNHALDKGKEGLLNCLEFWEASYPDLSIVGIHKDAAENEEIDIIEINGIKIAILNYTYSTNGKKLPEDMPYCVDMLQEKQVKADLLAVEEAADFTIVCPHWGTEYQLSASAQQKKWTKLFLENGADLILGTHPHVIEPIEWVTDEATGAQMLVYYSLGNFVNWTSGKGDGVANRMVGGMAQVTLTKEDSGKVIISDNSIVPLVCHVTEAYQGITVYKLSDYTEELAQENAIISQDPAFSLDYCKQLCKDVWGEF